MSLIRADIGVARPTWLERRVQEQADRCGAHGARSRFGPRGLMRSFRACPYSGGQFAMRCSLFGGGVRPVFSPCALKADRHDGHSRLRGDAVRLCVGPVLNTGDPLLLGGGKRGRWGRFKRRAGEIAPRCAISILPGRRPVNCGRISAVKGGHPCADCRRMPLLMHGDLDPCLVLYYRAAQTAL